MEPRPTLVAQLQHLAALPLHSGPEVTQAALFNLMLDTAATEQAAVSESIARLKAIHAVRVAGHASRDTLDCLSELGEMEQQRLQMAMDRLQADDDAVQPAQEERRYRRRHHPEPQIAVPR